MRMTRTVSCFAMLGLSLVAGCRSDDPNTGDDGPNVDAPVTSDMTIQDVQNDGLPAGSPVSLSGVIVTAVDTFGARTGDIWVQDPAGGPFSGIKVFGTPLEQVALLVPGDIVTITGGEKDKFALEADTSGRTVTELKPLSGGMMSVTKTGTGVMPTPSVVDGLAISTMAAADQDLEWEKWEGVLITVTNARQTTAIGPFGDGAADQMKFDITGEVVVESVLGGFPETAVPQTCYAGLTGIGDYFFDHLLLPRSGADLVAGGTGCAASQTATIAEIQAGTKLGPVEVVDVYVTAVTFNKKHFWIASSLTAAPNDGVAVFRGVGMTVPVLPADVVVGAKVTVSGTAVEGNNDMVGDTVTQITGPAITVTAAPGATPILPVVGQTVADLSQTATGEPYESVLVTLTNVKVTTLGVQPNYLSTLTQNGTAFKADDDIYRFVAADADKCYATITGLWTYSIFENAYGFLPTAAGTGIGTCN